MPKAKRGQRKPRKTSTLKFEEVPKFTTTQEVPLSHEHCGGIKPDLRWEEFEKEIREGARKRRIKRASDLRGAGDIVFSV